jgi:ubiquinone/menaquinone biosynthesis C-methylase UbiE
MKTFNGCSQSLLYYSGIIPHPEIDRWELSLYSQIITQKCNSLVDLGCGTGDFLSLASKLFPYAVGVDLNSSSIKICQKKGIPAYKQNATKTYFENNSFDIVRAQNILEHLPQPDKLITEAYRILKPRGYLVIHVPTQFSTFYPITNFWDDYTHVRPFTKRCLYRLLNDFKFKLIYSKGYTVGRNSVETIIGKIIEKFIPFCWFAIAIKK